MYKKTQSKTVKNMMMASIGVILSISSVSVLAAHPDNGVPSRLCFKVGPSSQLRPDSRFNDPEGSFIAIGISRQTVIPVMGKSLKVREARGMSIGRVPIPGAVQQWGDWVGSPLTGTCHKHDDQIQCGFQTMASTTFGSFLGSSVTTGVGQLTFVHNLDDESTTMTLIASGHASYFDPAGDLVPDEVAATQGLPTFMKIKETENIEKVNCRTVPHPEIAPLYSPSGN